MDIRNLVRAVRSYIVLTCFVSLISLNFYVNVWVEDANENFVLELSPDHSSHPESKYILLGYKNNSSIGNTSKPPSEVTPRNYLEAPMTYGHSDKTKTTSPPPKLPGLWPELENYEDDRIEKQLNYRPVSIDTSTTSIPVKTILLYNGYKDWGVKAGRQTFLEQKCPISHCQLTDNRRYASSADAVLFRQNPRFPWYRRPPGQVWILYLLEAPYFTPSLRRFNGHFNWTASYRRDSDIVAPYEKFVKYNRTVPHIQPKLTKNYAAGKTKKVAWFVSNCRATNTRLEYAEELSKYIQVDIFGKCGDKKCPRGQNSCSEMLNKEYKFYLSFENSNCRDYITEKFFFTGLQHDVIPIVMGAAPEDYRRVAPHYSFIHVDEYTSPRELAEYLNDLDQNDDIYNEYFKWKGTGSFINTYFWCRVCAMLHDTSRAHTNYGNIEEWWRGRDVCIGRDKWGQHTRRVPYISDYYKKYHH
ncbi:glycoprotein 3-alpha-L-fucosyltransferase A-like [Mercenaria mercenaria]|uniref:glycoprotein 3-alpha-L-fucosyltransferase A-like n=1 Tax=Mercenaria mercenaria TaxID=6596 RepID=UPI001E1D4D11|nr:glycoprotein 3-alpha-L-fucosyltransferase A-like [Mercenaria mercenaria]